MKLEYNLRFDGRSEQFVPMQIRLDGQFYQIESNDLGKKVLENISEEQKKAQEKLNREFSRTNIPFGTFCAVANPSLLFYSIIKEI